jgi:hypothetical protein
MIGPELGVCSMRGLLLPTSLVWLLLAAEWLIDRKRLAALNSGWQALTVPMKFRYGIYRNVPKETILECDIVCVIAVRLPRTKYYTPATVLADFPGARVTVDPQVPSAAWQWKMCGAPSRHACVAKRPYHCGVGLSGPAPDWNSQSVRAL